MIEKEIAKQINKKLDGAIERIVTREVNKTLSQSQVIDKTAVELIKIDKDFRRRVGESCATELYNKLTNYEDDYGNDNWED